MSRKLEVELTDTLMAWAGESHMPSGGRLSTYYLSVPDSWAALAPAELKDNVMGVFRDIYNDFNKHFREAEPNDISYLAPLEVGPRVLTPEEEKAAPWLKAKVPAVWEWTPCVVVDEDGKYMKVVPSEF
jgi:hypothetical protein